MKKSKKAFDLNKQKNATLNNELKKNIKGGTIIQNTIFTTDPTPASHCFHCPPDPILK